MALVTDYATLRAHIADTLNRTDLTSVIPNFIQQFEQRAKDDSRLIRLSSRGTVSISSDDLVLPDDMYSLESWYHDGGTYFGPIEIVGADQIGSLKAQFGATGVPQFASIVGRRARFAPVPSETYDTKMTYWQTVSSLADTNTNWLLDTRPDIYLYGSLVEAHHYLKNPEKMALARQHVEGLIESHHAATVDAQFGATMSRRNITPIGG